MRQLLTPRMLALHLLVLLVVAVLARLGVWQLSRLDEARTRTDTALARLEQPVTDVDAVVPATAPDDPALNDLEFRRVEATGTWRPADEVLQRGRSLNGRSGFHVLTPLDLTAGRTLLVRRGWVPFDNELRPPVADAAPPAGTVAVSGYLERSIPQPTGPVAQRYSDEGELEVVFNADLERLAAQLGGDVVPMLLHLEDQSPAPDGDLPVPAPRPELDNGPHLSYAIQWFSFATIALGMYALWLRRRAVGDERAVSHG